MKRNLVPFFQQVEFETAKYWQHTGQNLMTPIANIDDRSRETRELQVDLYEYFDKVDVVRCYLGIRAEFTEHSIDPGLDEYSDIIFYLARVYNYFELDKVFYHGYPLELAGQYLDSMDQPIRNMLRPTPLKEKHAKILINSLQKFAGIIMAHGAFKGYTEEKVLKQLHAKLSPRYKA